MYFSKSHLPHLFSMVGLQFLPILKSIPKSAAFTMFIFSVRWILWVCHFFQKIVCVCLPCKLTCRLQQVLTVNTAKWSIPNFYFEKCLMNPFAKSSLDERNSQQLFPVEKRFTTLSHENIGKQVWRKITIKDTVLAYVKST